MKKLSVIAVFFVLIPSFSYAQDTIKIGPQDDDQVQNSQMPQMMNQMINSFFGPGNTANDPFAHSGFIPFKAIGGIAEYPQMDMYMTDKTIEIVADLPGIKKEDINLRVENGMVSISHENKNDVQEKGKTYILSEREHGSFERAISLPSNADEEHATSEYKEGVLYIHIPKTEKGKEKGKKIEIK